MSEGAPHPPGWIGPRSPMAFCLPVADGSAWIHGLSECFQDPIYFWIPLVGDSSVWC